MPPKGFTNTSQYIEKNLKVTKGDIIHVRQTREAIEGEKSHSMLYLETMIKYVTDDQFKAVQVTIFLAWLKTA